MYRTDLAHEAVRDIKTFRHTKENLHGIHTTSVTIDAEQGKKIGKPAGTYYTMHTPDRLVAEETAALAQVLKRLLPENINSGGSPAGGVMVAGLGNESVTPDSLGTRAAKRVLATAHFKGHRDYRETFTNCVYVCRPGVAQQTGIESADTIRFSAEGVRPDCIIVIDSLACGSMERLASTIQAASSGIAPGSGVSNSRPEISEKTMGVPVIALGVPTVLDLSALAGDAPEYANAMVLDRDVDAQVRHFARVIGDAVNSALNPALTYDEIELLRGV